MMSLFCLDDTYIVFVVFYTISFDVGKRNNVCFEKVAHNAFEYSIQIHLQKKNNVVLNWSYFT